MKLDLKEACRQMDDLHQQLEIKEDENKELSEKLEAQKLKA